MKKIIELEQRLEKLTSEIRETKKRLPAHSTKPPVMMDLLNLEDEFDSILEQIRDIKGYRSSKMYH